MSSEKMNGYVTCPDCGEKAYRQEDGKFFCKKCNREVKPKATSGWSKK